MITTRNRLRGGLAVFGTLLPVMTFIAAVIAANADAGLELIMKLTLAGMVGTVILPIVSAVVHQSSKLLTVASASKTALMISGRRYSREAIASGFMDDWGIYGGRIELQLTNGDALQLTFDEGQIAKRFLEKLELDPEHHRATFRAPRAGARTSLGCLGSLSIFFWFILFASLADTPLPAHAIALALFFTTLSVVGLPALVARPTVTVGSDGVEIKRRFRRTFIPLIEIGVVTFNGDVLLIDHTGHRWQRVQLDATAAPGAVARIEAALAKIGRSGAKVAVDIGGDYATARDRMTKVLRPVDGYRHVRVSPNDLVDVLANPAEPPARRVGAAWALGVSDAVDARARARVAKDTIADEKIRVLVERALEDELVEADLEATMAEEEARRRAAAKRR